MPLNVELVAADRQVWSGEATAVQARTADGEIGIMAGHAPLLGLMVQGEVKILGSHEPVVAKVDGGFLSIENDRVIIVAERAQLSAVSAG